MDEDDPEGDIEVHLDREGGHLRLSCEKEEEFARLRDLIISEAGVADLIDSLDEKSPREGIERIEIESVPAILAARNQPRRAADFARGLVVIAVVLTLLVGFWTILQWTARHLP